MHKLLQKVFDIKHDLSSGGQQTTVDGAALAAGLSAFVTEQDFYRYRKQKGVNLGVCVSLSTSLHMALVSQPRMITT